MSKKVHYTVEAFTSDMSDILSEISASPVRYKHGSFIIVTDMCTNEIEDFVKKSVKRLKDGFLDGPYWYIRNIELPGNHENMHEIEFYNLDVNDGRGTK